MMKVGKKGEEILCFRLVASGGFPGRKRPSVVAAAALGCQSERERNEKTETVICRRHSSSSLLADRWDFKPAFNSSRV